MKRTLAILVAVLVIALSAIPAFAAENDYVSPKATVANYQITIIPGGGGGTYDFTYKTPVDDDGKQTVHFVAKPDDGYEFTGWTFDGNYTLLGNLTDTELDVIVSSDIKATPNFKKIGSLTTAQSHLRPAQTMFTLVLLVLLLSACCLPQRKPFTKNNNQEGMKRNGQPFLFFT